MYKSFYIRILILCMAVSVAQLQSYEQADMEKYLQQRSAKKIEYEQKYPKLSELERYKLYLQETYSSHDTNAMYEKDLIIIKQVTVSKHDTLWKIVGSDWEILYPDQKQKEKFITWKQPIVTLAALFGIPLVFSVCYKFANYAKKQYLKQKQIKKTGNPELSQ